MAGVSRSVLGERFAELIAAGESEVDVEPLRVVADALLAAEKACA